MPTDRVYRHRQQAQTRKRAVNAGTTRPPQARRSSTRSGLNATPQNPGLHSAIKRISGQLGINPEALRTWVRAVEQGGRNERGEISDQEARIRALEAENRELRRANEILKAASAFFGAELDRLGR